MKTNEIRSRFLKFFEKRGHEIIPSASLITTDEKGITNSTLFNTAGMQPLVPYLLGKEHPKGKRLADSQKCIRTVDIDEVGDNTHATFFEMLGNWSLGDYFKEEAIQWSYEFLTSKEEGLGLDPSRLYITVFEGNEDAPRDDEAAEIWKKYIPENRIYYMSADSNWWSAGENGPCGPDTEIFYDVKGGLGDMTKEEYMAADDRQDVVEIWNNVFMEYEKKDGKVVGKLPNKNVDTGAGLERFAAVLQEKDSIFDTDNFKELMDLITADVAKEKMDERLVRIIVDHLKSSIFLIADGVEPSNIGRGYIVRRLLRRVLRNKHKLGIINTNHGYKFLDTLIKQYGDIYPELEKNKDFILENLKEEKQTFQKPLNWLEEYKKDLLAAKEDFNQNKKIKDIAILKDQKTASGEYVYNNYQTYGVPYDLSIDIVKEVGLDFDQESFDKLFAQHKEESRKGAEQKFKGGLASTGAEETKYHTATHLLHAALREVLGDHVFQKGSNITADRLRFDFSHPEKMTDEEKSKVENLVNEKIKSSLSVTQVEMDYDEAKKLGAMGLFEDKYEDKVSVYTIGNDKEVFSRELCGGPHVSNTSELGNFKIKKEEASSAGVRRIKAILE